MGLHGVWGMFIIARIPLKSQYPGKFEVFLFVMFLAYFWRLVDRLRVLRKPSTIQLRAGLYLKVLGVLDFQTMMSRFYVNLLKSVAPHSNISQKIELIGYMIPANDTSMRTASINKDHRAEIKYFTE